MAQPKKIQSPYNTLIDVLRLQQDNLLQQIDTLLVEQITAPNNTLFNNLQGMVYNHNNTLSKYVGISKFFYEQFGTHLENDGKYPVIENQRFYIPCANNGYPILGLKLPATNKSVGVQKSIPTITVYRANKSVLNISLSGLHQYSTQIDVPVKLVADREILVQLNKWLKAHYVVSQKLAVIEAEKAELNSLIQKLPTGELPDYVSINNPNHIRALAEAHREVSKGNSESLYSAWRRYYNILQEAEETFIYAWD